MKRLLNAITAGFWTLCKCLWYPDYSFDGCYGVCIGDAPDIQNAMRYGYPDSPSRSVRICNDCENEINTDGQAVEDFLCQCGRLICVDCKKTCVGCEDFTGCEFCMEYNKETDGYYCDLDCLVYHEEKKNR